MRISLISLAVLIPFAAPLLQSVPRPVVPGPPAVYSSGAAFDGNRGALVVFGGFTGRDYSDETWEWRGGEWHPLRIAGPAPRNGPEMAYDASRHRMVLFGGDTRGRQFGDTWEFDGTAWTRVAESGPAGRTGHRLAYDARRRRTVLFGGMTTVGTATAFGDTWEWDGSRWTQVSSRGPDARSLFAMAYDASIERVVLFGGSAGARMPPTPQDLRGDTWEWDGAVWTEKGGAGPPPRDHAAMAFDSVASRLVLTAGARGEDGPVADTWTRTGRTWAPLSTSGRAGAVAGHHLFFDQRAGAVMRFGGFGGGGPVSDLWSLKGGVWTRVQ